MYYRHRTREFVDENVIGRINKAKVIMREGIYDNLSAKDVADRLHTGYSGFRKAFKEFTGTSPAQYMQELKLNEAKRLLTTTSRPIKEISFSLKYDNPEYLFDLFQTAYVDDSGRVPSAGTSRQGRSVAGVGDGRCLARRGDCVVGKPLGRRLAAT